jgi:PKD repeat protein
MLLLGLMSLTANAQHEYDNWYFGDSCAVSFISGMPVNLPNGHLATDEGCSSISDSAGNLLFYTRGSYVYNSDHQVMPNGSGLLGSWTSTQAALIAKMPGTSKQYYLFTTAGQGDPEGFCYSVIDMSLDSGLGDVTAIKNVQLLSPVDEKLTAVATESGFWLLTHQYPNSYYAYRVTATGIEPPIISQIGWSCGTFIPEQGSIKFSPDGHYFVSCFMNDHRFDLGRFNDTTGIATEVYTYFSGSLVSYYGAEFSRTGSVLYVSTIGTPAKVFQLDMSAGSLSAIASTIQQISPAIDGDNGGALQIAPDGKIYSPVHVSNINYSRLRAINNPDSIGAACGYDDAAFYLTGMSQFGLPNNVVRPYTLFFQPQSSIEAITTKICPDSCISFGNQSTDATSFEWFFQGATPSYSTDENPTNICYSTSGNYDVTLIAHIGPYSDTTVSQSLIQVYAPPSPTVVQSNDTVYVTNPQSGDGYQWSFNNTIISGATNDFYVASTGGIFTVNVTNANGCAGSTDLDFHVGIESTESEAKLELFPNPADAVVTVSLSTNQQATVTIYNTLGQPVYSALVTRVATIDVSQLPVGLYLLSAQTDNDVIAKRLVVTR